MIARTIDESCETVSAQFTKCRVDREPSRTSRPLWVPIEFVAGGILEHEVRVENRQAASMRLAMPDCDKAAVLWHVQPFVAICRPPVGEIEPGGEFVEARACARKQPEGAVNVHPGSVAMREWDECREWIKDTQIEVAGIEGNNYRPAAGCESGLECLWFEPTV